MGKQRAKLPVNLSKRFLLRQLGWMLALLASTLPPNPVSAQSGSASEAEQEGIELLDYRGGEEHRHGYTIHFEQDAFNFDSSKNEDRDYTQGTSVEWFGTRLDEAPFFNKPLNFIDNKIDDWLNLEIKHGVKIDDSLTLGLKAFTPEDIDLEEPIEDDRPYASYIFITDTKIREFENSTYRNRAYLRTAFTIGTLGNSISEDFQNMVHQINDMPDDRIPRGWDNQIDEPLVFNYQITRLRNRQFQLSNRLTSDFGTFWGGNVGTIFLDVYTGVSGRFGVYQNEFVSLPGLDPTKPMEFRPAPKRQQSFSTNGSGTNGEEKRCRILGWGIYECYLFATLTLKGVVSNRLLEGYSGDPVRIPSSDLEPLVALASVGFTLKISKHFTLSIAQFARTSEFESDRPDSDRNHYYGGLYLAVENPF